MTTNHAEAYNNAFSKDLNYTKVSILKFIDVLIKRQSFIEKELKCILSNPSKIISAKKQEEKISKMLIVIENYKCIVILIF
jgi:hypothetical protein